MGKKQITYVDPDNSKTEDERNDARERSSSNLAYRNPTSRKKTVDTRQRKAALVWKNVVPVADRVKELDEIGMKFLNNKVKMTKDQLTVWKSLFETYSSKLIPSLKAKPSDVSSPKTVFNFSGAPKEGKYIQPEDTDEVEEEIEDDKE